MVPADRQFTISAGCSTDTTVTPKLRLFVNGAVIRCSERSAAARFAPGRKFTKIPSGPVTGSLMGFLAAARIS
jgi:hypothetical protein